NGQAALLTFTVSVTAGVTTFTANLPHTTPSSHSLAGPENDSSTYELLVIRNGKKFAYRILDISFSAAGVISFSVPSDLSFLIDSGTDKVSGYLFQGGMLKREALDSAEVGTFQKPSIEDVNIQPVQWSFTGDG